MEFYGEFQQGRVLEFVGFVGSFSDYPLHYLESASVHVELSQTVDGVEDVVSSDGKSVLHPTLEGGDDGLVSGELLNPQR